jgi:hypothetical protein
MRGWFGCFCWGGLGALVVGWASALLSYYAIYVPSFRILGGATTGPMLASIAHRAHGLVWLGILMGAASGVCLARYLCCGAALKLHSEAPEAAVGLMIPLFALLLQLPSVDLLGGSVVGVGVSRNSATIIGMDIYTPEQQPDVPMGHAGGVFTFGHCKATYRDRSVVIITQLSIHNFPWR